MAFMNIALQLVDKTVALQFLLLGYGAFWLIGIVYVISLINRQRNLRQDIHLLKQLLEEDERRKKG